MLFALAGLSLLAATVQAVPYERRGLAEIPTNCNHGFAYTFDDGPYIYHNEILDKFDQFGDKTTFFVNGNNWGCIYDQANVDALRRSYESGHMLASHTWSHASIPSLSNSQIDYEIQRLDEALVKILGVKPKFLRPPYGDINEQTANYIQQTYGKTIVLWSDDSGDSTGGTAQQSFNFYNSFTGGTHMTLSHETQSAAIDAIRMGAVDVLNNHGINSITVGQCLDRSDIYEVVGGYGTRDSTWTCSGNWTPTPPGNNPPTPTCAARYTSVAGDNCNSIGAKYGIPGSEILAANTFLNCNDIWVGTPICVPRIGSTSSTTVPPPTGTCSGTYTSVAGDTCNSIGTKYHVSGASILQYNSFLNCNDIWVGTPICLPPGATTANPSSTQSSVGPQPTCVSTYTSVSGDTCDSIGTKYGLSGSAILAANTFLNCNDIWVNTPICIPPGGQSPTCTLTISSQPGATCASIGAQYGVSAAQILAWNSFLNCNDIWTNTPVCVRH